MLKAVLVMILGGIGCLSRYGVGIAAQRLAGGRFPVGTLLVNVLGCFCAGLAAAYFATRGAGREEWRIAVMAGFLGGFTTFSAFGVQTFDLLRNGRCGHAALNIALSVTLGLLAVWAGYRIGLSSLPPQP